MNGRYKRLEDLKKLMPTEHEFRGAFLEKLGRAYDMGRQDLWDELEAQTEALEALKAAQSQPEGKADG